MSCAVLKSDLEALKPILRLLRCSQLPMYAVARFNVVVPPLFYIIVHLLLIRSMTTVANCMTCTYIYVIRFKNPYHLQLCGLKKSKKS